LDKIVKIFPSSDELALKFAEELALMINASAKVKKTFTVALSGGSTPEALFALLGSKYAQSIQWEYVHFFWGDERCVPPDNSESNFAMTNRTLLSKIQVPSTNIHRIKGEDDPEIEAVRYSEEILSSTRNKHGLPVFDLILLGLGDDGHTASIFPGHLEMLNSDKICLTASHPVTQQKRITLTGRVINNADDVVFLVTGKKKEDIVEKILKNKAEAINYPAFYIVPAYGSLRWFLDEDAGRLI
jgi:6-phosphogluconolactonase